MQIHIPDELKAVITEGKQPVVAADSTPFTGRFGITPPFHERAFRAASDAVAQVGAHYAVTAVLDGEPTFVNGEDQLERVLKAGGTATYADVRSCIRETGDDRSTTISAALAIASSAEIQVVATSGFGTIGIDLTVSEDLIQLPRFSGVVVCAGSNPFGDIPASLDFLHEQGVQFVGYRTSVVPAYFSLTEIPLEHTVADASEVQAFVDKGRPVLLFVPPPDPVSADLLAPMIADAERVAAEIADPAERSAKRWSWLRSEYADYGQNDSNMMPKLNIDLIVQNAAVAIEVAREIEFPRGHVNQLFAGR